MIRYLKLINPLWFILKSFSYMEGHSYWYIITRMPLAYYRYCRGVFHDLKTIKE